MAETDWATKQAEELLSCYCKPNRHRRGCFVTLRKPVAALLRLARSNALEEAAKVTDKQRVVYLEWADSTFTKQADGTQQSAQSLANSMEAVAGEIRALKEHP